MSVNTSNLCMRYSSESMISVRVFMVFEACRRYTFAYTEMNRSVEQRTKHDERECVIYESKRLSRVQDDRSLQTYLQLRTIRACWRDTSDFPTFHGCSYFESRRRSFSCAPKKRIVTLTKHVGAKVQRVTRLNETKLLPRR